MKTGSREKKALTFNPEKIDRVEAEFNDKKSIEAEIEEGNGSNDDKYSEVQREPVKTRFFSYGRSYGA
jgi:hypothetical protein